MSSAEVINLNDRRPAVSEPETSAADTALKNSTVFALDTVADQWANDLVHDLMVKFSEGGSDINIDDPVYEKLMEGLMDVTLSMTRHHLGVFDETALMIQEYPKSVISVGILEMMDPENTDD